MNMKLGGRTAIAGWGLLTGILCLGAAGAAGSDEPPTSGGPTTFRRLSETQYKGSIADIFGADIKVAGRFDPPWREEGLLAIGDSKVVISASGFEQDELRARDIAAQVLSEAHRQSILGCAPPSFDATCARGFVEKYGRLLYRRPLDDDETGSVVRVAKDATAKTGDFRLGMQFALARLLGSPNFVFRVERTEADSATGRPRLDSYSLASRVSFLLWNAAPDPALLDAAASGALQTDDGLDQQVERMMASPKFEQGVRAFFIDMFGYERFDGLSKDQSLFPMYTSQLAKDAQEQTLRTVVNLLVTHEGDYRDLFTTRTTYMNRNLGALYGVPVSGDAVNGWAPYTFGPDDHREGVLTLAAYLMLDPTHEAKTSPTIRGKSIRELFLCQKVPSPPGNVDFSKFQDPKNPHPTVRERLTAHRENPVCAGCHSVMDPIGLAIENYDAVGSYRTSENGAPIDASGVFDGKPYADAIQLEKVLHEGKSATDCAARRVYEYGVGRPLSAGERDWITYLDARFASDHYDFPKLMRTVATSKAFAAVSAEVLASN
jgi:Protein of unknown function (DUF1592)/Protein of unknown function (DUF1588)/Protein of unknown function (DUF1595)/Protein of unknown function (DUF1585)